MTEHISRSVHQDTDAGDSIPVPTLPDDPVVARLVRENIRLQHERDALGIRLAAETVRRERAESEAARLLSIIHETHDNCAAIFARDRSQP